MKKVTTIVCLSLLASACSKTVKEVSYLPSTTTESKSNLNISFSADVEALRTLLKSDAPNLALAELLAKSISKEHQAELKSLIKELSPDEVEIIISQVKADNANVRDNYLFHGQIYGKNADFTANLLFDVENLGNQPFSLETQLKISTISYLKNKALDDIITTFNKRADQLASELANDIAIEIAQKHPEVVTQIESNLNTLSREKVIEMIRKTKPVLEKIDLYFKTSDLTENEQYVLTVGTVLAGAIYMQVKDNKGFKHLAKEAQKIAKDIKEFQQKAKEFSALVVTMKSHFTATYKNVNDLNSGIRGAKDDIVDLYGRIKTQGTSIDDVESKKIVDFLYKRVLKGQKANTDGSNPSIVTAKVNFNKNFEKSVNAAANLTNNLSQIITTADSFMRFFKMAPSKDLHRALETARKVNEVVKTVQAGITGFASGGFIGAVGAIASGPMASMMGGGSRDSAKLEEISRKLDVVIQQQQKMLEMQLETMNMIKDMAVMIDIYHQREMAAVVELRELSLVNMELLKAQMNKDIRSCERIINFQLSSVWKNMDFGKDAFYSINNLDLISSRFSYSIQGLQDIRRIVNSVEEDGFRNCQSAIAEAFSSNTYEENPIRAIYATNSNDNLYAFQRETYWPLLSGLKYFAETPNFDSMPLHLPVKKVSDLKIKNLHIYEAKTIASSNEVYDMDQLLSAKNLERYLSHLIVLLPLLEVDKSVWQKSYEDIIGTYLENSNSGNNQNIRSYYFLSNALKITQSAIAQEALLAGEPILRPLYKELLSEIVDGADCSTLRSSVSDDYPFICSVRENRLLMKNLIMYAYSEEGREVPGLLEQYQVAFMKGDLSTLGRLLNIQLSGDKFQVTKLENGITQEVVIKVVAKNKQSIAIKLPTPEELREGKIIYSENMSRLLKMQEVILNGLEKVAPIKRDGKEDDLLKLLLVGA